MFSKAEIQKAKDANLVDLLLDLNYPLKKVTNREYCLVSHDSCKISPDKGFYWHSRDVGGNAIDFFMIVENMTFTQSVFQILSRSGSIPSEVSTPSAINRREEPQTPERTFKTPVANWNNTRVINYLTLIRKIDRSLVMYCIHAKRLYEATHSHNAVFLGCDDNGVPRHAFQRGTTEKRFAGDVEGSDKRYGFFLGNDKSPVLYLFESPIDLLSYITLQKYQGNKCPFAYLSLSGISLFAFIEYIKERNVESVFVATDNDTIGHKVYERVQAYCTENELNITVFPAYPKKKDYNEDLVTLAI